jgi:hypothetical protein
VGSAFQTRIEKAREREILIHRTLRFIAASFLIPTFSNLLMFGIYWVLGNELSLSTVFTGLSVINLLRLQWSSSKFHLFFGFVIFGWNVETVTEG